MEGAVIVIVVVIVLASVGAGVIFVLLKKGAIDLSKLKRKKVDLVFN